MRVPSYDAPFPPQKRLFQESIPENPFDHLYLFDSYVQNDLEKILQRVMINHDNCINTGLDGVYDLDNKRLVTTGIHTLQLTADAILRDGSVARGQSFIFPIDESSERRIRMQNYFGPFFTTEHEVFVTQQTLNQVQYITITQEDGQNLTPLWGIWTNQACPFPRPCNITFNLETGNGKVVTETYNLSTAGIGTNTPSFVALPEFVLSSGDVIRIIFYLEPESPENNSLKKIIIQVRRPIRSARFRDRLKSRFFNETQLY
jgi:hypothetical protein